MEDLRRPNRLLILGLGNVVCGDDGLGIAAVELLRRRHVLPENVEALDGGTLGLTLLAQLRDFEDVILVDAIRSEGQAGTFVRIEDEEVAPAVRERLSVHQVGVADLLDAMRLLDAYPRRLTLLGLVPQSLELGLALSACVESGLSLLVEELVEEAQRLGYDLRRRRETEEVPAGSSSPVLRALGL